MLDLLIKNGVIVDGQSSMRGSIGIAGSRIAGRFASGLDLPAARQVVDAKGLLVMPGVIDPHVHFYGEGIGEYSKLAVQGGVTTFIGMIRGAPEEPLAAVVDRHLNDGSAASVTDFSFHIVLYDREDTVAQISDLAKRGFRSYKMFLAYKRRGMMVRDAFLFEAMHEIRKHGGIALAHAENGEFIDYMEQRAIREGRTSVEHYEPTRPAEAEAASIELLALAAHATGCPTYVVHLSSDQGLAAIHRARRRGVPIWVETCPQYLLMDNDTMCRHGATAKIAPPLRTKADLRALGTALLTGALNTIGSDHASYGLSAKQVDCANIFDSPFGMSGAPTLFPAMFTWALDHNVPLPIVVRAMSETPARLFGLSHRKGTLAPGADADIILVDPKARQKVDFKTHSPNVCPSPLEGESLAGWPLVTVSRGEVVWRDGRVTGTAGRGEVVPQQGTQIASLEA